MGGKGRERTRELARKTPAHRQFPSCMPLACAFVVGGKEQEPFSLAHPSESAATLFPLAWGTREPDSSLLWLRGKGITTGARR